MTIAVALKVRDGIVLAADSATTLTGPQGTAANIFNHANKIVNLRKGLPIGFMTWGLGGFNSSSIASLAKDFRSEWGTRFPPGDSHTVEDVAKEMKAFLDASVTETVKEIPVEERSFGFVIAGHSTSQSLGEGWVVSLDASSGALTEPAPVLPGEVGLTWWGVPKWIQRVVLGVDLDALAPFLVDDLKLPQENLQAAIDAFRRRAQADFLHPAMPIQDAINVGRFLVDCTKSAVEFCSGAPVVGGPTEIAAITKHEGFKWVQRKYYFQSELNPDTRG